MFSWIELNPYVTANARLSMHANIVHHFAKYVIDSSLQVSIERCMGDDGFANTFG